jgi:hypothetical protein
MLILIFDIFCCILVTGGENCLLYDEPYGGTTGDCGYVVNNGFTCSIQCSTGFTLVGQEYTCFSGMLIPGSPVQSCQFTATNACPPLRTSQLPANNAGTGSCGGVITNGGTCNIACAAGYVVSGSAYQCSSNGGTFALTGAQTCVPAVTTCSAFTGTLPSGANGIGSCTAGKAIGTSCQVACLSGYSITGGYTCASNGVYTGTQTCTPPAAAITCSNVTPLPANAVQGACAGTISTNSICNVDCNSGYTRSGAPYICGADGLFTGTQTCTANTAPTCTNVSPLPANSVQGSCGVTVAANTFCNIECNSGYTRSGSPYACNNGILTGSQTCTQSLVVCPAFSIPPSHGLLGSCGFEGNVNDLCSFSCQSGWRILGDQVYVCQSNGQWSGAQICVQDTTFTWVTVPGNQCICGTSTVGFQPDLVVCYNQAGALVSDSNCASATAKPTATSGQQCECTGQILGDPQFTGFHGQSYQVHGVDGYIYNIISSPDVHINERFVFLEQGHCKRGMKNCFSHPGSYIGEVGLIVRNKPTTNEIVHLNSEEQNMNLNNSIPMSRSFARRINVVAGSWKSGLLVTIDDHPITAPYIHYELLNSTTATFLLDYSDASHVFIRTAEFDMWFENNDHFMNQKFEMRHRVRTTSTGVLTPHGILGQTWQQKTYNNKFKYIAGDVDDYVMKDIYSTENINSRFQME